MTKRHNELTIKIFASNSIITNTNSTNFLGLIIDNTSSWRDHSNITAGKAAMICLHPCHALQTQQLKGSIAPSSQKSTFSFSCLKMKLLNTWFKQMILIMEASENKNGTS